ncbi:MAG: penicillin-binding protein 1C, partial [Bacteroidota bacterium]
MKTLPYILKWAKFVGIGLPLLGALIFLIIPPSEPSLPLSTVLNDRHGNLLSASIAADEQWRFPRPDSIPARLRTCMLLFEDEHFYRHPGINPLALARATYQNVSAGRVVSGASTITMQVARMMEREERTLLQKLKEMAMAVRLELHWPKDEIIKIYAAMAPFGGNVVGMEAASWRYFQRAPHLLSWAESAALAVLPNQPGDIYPGTGQVDFLRKRDFLLIKVYDRGLIDSIELVLSLEEPLPGEPYDIPQKAPHLLTTVSNDNAGQNINTTIDPFWQGRVSEVAERKHQVLKGNGVENLAVLVVDLEDGSVLSYVGNTQDQESDGHEVDVIQRPRSSGSILKPFLYAAALSEGLILPETLLSDIPSFFGGYSPKNFSRGYQGMVNANDALAMSLNIPFAHLLKDYSYERFHHKLTEMGISTLNQPPGHYGLTMILGGAEVKLWELAQAYFSMYRKMANEYNLTISYANDSERIADIDLEEIGIWHTFNAMTELKRSGADEHWQHFNSSQVLAWKTGTSFGFRDAWAVGLNGEVLIAVWVGNADGEGRAGMTGATTAGPILSELIRLAPNDPNWLSELEPFSTPKEVCSVSGMLAGYHCTHTKTMGLGQKAERSGMCKYHVPVWMDESGTYQVNRDCYPSEMTQQQSAFVLPSTQGYYYGHHHSDYQGRPSLLEGCGNESAGVLAINYPQPGSKIFIPRELAGSTSQVVIEAAHQDMSAELFWHINDEYIGSTQHDH